jgi:phenylalanyl-tRNA synthetase beta chain
VPGIYRNLAENRKHFERFRLFEIGREIHKQASGLPREIPHLVAAIYSRDESQTGLFELKSAAECFLPGAETCPAAARPYEHPARAGAVMRRGEKVGRIFELHPAMLEGRAALLDLDLEIVQKLRPRDKTYTPLRRYPSSQFDLSVIAGARELVADLRATILEKAGGLLESVEYVRQYSGPPLPENTKSVSFRVTISSPERTLSSEEAAEVRTAIIVALKLRGYELRV